MRAPAASAASIKTMFSAAAIYRPDHFGIVAAITQQFGMAIQMVHHAPAHHYRNRLHALLQSGDTQAVPAAFGQREVDRATAEKPGLARIGTALENVDCETALRQQGSEQGTDEAGTDDGHFPHHCDIFHFTAHSTKRRQSI